MSAADRGGRVAPPPADPSQATGRVKRRDNQLHRARVLEVRIQPPPAGESTNFWFLKLRNRNGDDCLVATNRSARFRSAGHAN